MAVGRSLSQLPLTLAVGIHDPDCTAPDEGDLAIRSRGARVHRPNEGTHIYREEHERRENPAGAALCTDEPAPPQRASDASAVAAQASLMLAR
jgi:hypothetical protein